MTLTYLSVHEPFLVPGTLRGYLFELKAAICSWRYMRKALEVQRPCLQIVAVSAPFSFRAMAQPAQRECKLTMAGMKPCAARLRELIASFRTRLMSDAKTWCQVFPLR